MLMVISYLDYFPTCSLLHSSYSFCLSACLPGALNLASPRNLLHFNGPFPRVCPLTSTGCQAHAGSASHDYLPFQPPRLYSLAGPRNSEPVTFWTGSPAYHDGRTGHLHSISQFAILRKCNNTLHTNYVGKVSQMTAICLVQHTDTEVEGS